MNPEWGQAFLHVAVAGGLCAVAVFTGIFDSVSV
ncbi:TMEM187 isoform 3, partial [Pongo abelii]